MFTDIRRLAENILDQAPGPVVCRRLMRDVLRVGENYSRQQSLLQSLDHSRWVQLLALEQRNDGSWGAFHSRDTRLKVRVLTTEMGVSRALALGLDTGHPVLQLAEQYLLRLLRSEIPFPDRCEQNDRWPIGVRLFVASTLSQVHPGHPVLEPDRFLWLEIARRTFRTGTFSESDELAAHQAFTGANVKDSYLSLRGKYQLNLLGSVPGLLPADLEKALLCWLWSHPKGIGYLSVPLNLIPENQPQVIDRWLSSLELLAQCFPSWSSVATPAIDWLMAQQKPAGLWDFGPLPRESLCLPFSDSWRNLRSRQLDWTVRVILLLSRLV
jgi:hypothetical protein